MKQGSEEWHGWRSKGIGASDAPVILGVSPWKTKHQLWLEKTGQVKDEFKGNWATNRGNELEPIARANYEFLHNKSMPPVNVTHKEYDFLRASLDGFDGETILEIKCPGRDDHETALSGKVPEKYYPQLQHQLMVTGAKECHYWSFDGEKGALVIVTPDINYINSLINEERIFWQNVLDKIPPPLGEKDYKPVTEKDLQQLLVEWRATNEVITKATILEKDIRELINKKTEGQSRLQYENIQVIRSERKGNIDYSKVPQIQGLDLEQYRKPASEVFTLKIQK